nr:putative zeta toxin domain, P-loop containing nucleoside triphosphate hydrolase [Tanacetum cinerariifolium]
MVEELNVINTPKKGDTTVDAFTEVMGAMAHCDRSPVLLFIGGGMGAGKSTALKEILKEIINQWNGIYGGGSWADAAENAVVVEADAFKETDVIYRALSSKGHHNDMLQIAELVQYLSPTSSLLVTTLNDGRDVIMDGTLSWELFVEQTIAMARSVHKHRYRMGVVYKVSDDGTITENYWEKVEDEEDDFIPKTPYKIEMLGVVCDPYLVVTRGIRPSDSHDQRVQYDGRHSNDEKSITIEKPKVSEIKKSCPPSRVIGPAMPTLELLSVAAKLTLS